MCSCCDEQLSTFVALNDDPITLLTEVFPQQSWEGSALEGRREQPTLRLRVSSDFHSVEIYFGNFEIALTLASAIQDMVDDGLEAIKSHSDTYSTRKSPGHKTTAGAVADTYPLLTAKLVRGR